MTISSPSPRKARPHPYATRLIDSVVPRVNTSRDASSTRKKRAIRDRAPSYAAVGVRVVESVVVRLRLDHLDGLLRRCPGVEVDERFAVEGALEDREVTADRFDVEPAHLTPPPRPVPRRRRRAPRSRAPAGCPRTPCPRARAPAQDPRTSRSVPAS